MNTPMALSCHLCSYESPDDAFFCISCGAVLQPGSIQTTIRPISSTGPTLRISSTLLRFTPLRPGLASLTWQQLVSWAAVPLVALAYSVVFLIGIMQVIEYGGIPGLGLWGIAPIVIGALLAEEQWMNGRLWSGLFGMAVWASFPWLLSLNLFTIGAILAAVWLVMHIASRRP